MFIIRLLVLKKTISDMLKAGDYFGNFPIKPNILELCVEQFAIKKEMGKLN